jgi:hypothetical protein
MSCSLKNRKYRSKKTKSLLPKDTSGRTDEADLHRTPDSIPETGTPKQATGAKA